MAIVKSTKKKIKCDKALYNAVLYVTKKEKAFAASFSSSEKFSAVDDVTELFKMIRQTHNKNGGILAHHFVQSFDPSDNITPELANKIAMDFAKKSFPNYEVLVVTHNDREHLHNHFILSAFGVEGGYKYHDCTDTLKHLQNISDELCRKNNLSVIESRGKGLDQETYQLALQGKSWKFTLTSVLDEAMEFCKSKDEFINFLYLRGYSVLYTDKNITVTKNGEKKGVRVDNLAKQFGLKYTKRNLENAMGYWQPPKEKVFTRYEPKLTSNYNGEWVRYERYIFSQMNKPPVTEIEKACFNIDLKSIIEQNGINFNGEIDLLEVVKLKELDCFFYAVKREDTAIVTVKEYNTEKLKSKVTLLDTADKILLREKREKSRNAKLNAKIKSTAESRGEKPNYKMVSESEFSRLKDSGIEFAYFKKEDRYNIIFLNEYANEINAVLKSARLEM